MKTRAVLAGIIIVVGMLFARYSQAAELLVLDWDPKIVTKDDHGFPTTGLPDGANGNWVSPVNYAGGTLQHRLELRSMPTSKRHSWQCCFHQNGITLENCGPTTNYFYGPAPGANPVVVTWSATISSMWKLNGIPIDWSQPRSVLFLVVRKGSSQYISDYAQLNGGNLWAGENPDEWYPMEIRFTTVAVSAGGSFSGWSNYVKSNQVRTPYFSPGSGYYANYVDVTMTTSSAGATIRYTTDGSDPTQQSAAYSGAVRLTSNITLKARAYKSGMVPSEVKSVKYLVYADTSPPKAGIIKVLDANTMTVRFSEKVEKTTAETAANYTITPGVTVSSASLGTDEQTVTLTTSQILSNTTYTLTVNNVEDLYQNVIAKDSKRTFTTGAVGVHILTGNKVIRSMGFTITPYPCQNQAVAVINVPTSQTGKVGVVDMEGKVALPSSEYSLIPGVNRISLYTDALADGIYLCRVKTGKQVLIRQIVVVKHNK